MKLYCPHCGVKGVADDSYRGKKVRCPKCSGTFVAEDDVAARSQQAHEQQAGIVTEEPRPSQFPAEEGLAGEPGVPAEEASPAEAEAGQEQTAREKAEAIRAEAIEAVEEEEAIVAHPVSEIPLEEEKEPTLEERETVLEWDETPSEIEAKDATESEERNREFTAGPSMETVGEDRSQPEVEKTAEPMIAEPSAESPDLETHPRNKEEIAAAEPMAERQGVAEAVKKEEIPDDHFIFEDRKREPETEVEEQSHGMIKEQCWQCGKKNRSDVSFSDRSGRLYCPACLPAAEPESAPEARPFAGPVGDALPREQEDTTLDSDEKPRFTIGRALREAWEKTKGAKGTIWAGSAVMYLTLIVLAAGGTFLFPGFGEEAAADVDIIAEIANFAFQTLTDVLSVLFTAGLLFMGIRKVAGDPITWKMIFTGFSDAGRIIVATVLQSLMIFLGFLVLVLPGIYLAVGYSMTIPLIVDRKMSPWQAMETSRKAVHKVWWRVVGLYLSMVLLFVVSLVPFGLGLIWTWPMFVILAGVVYRHLFRFEK